MPLLEIRNLNIRYLLNDRAVLACDDVSLTIEAQDSVGIVGESGSGKSTLAMGILGLLPRKITRLDGEILFQDNDLLMQSESELSKIRWRKLSAVFQKSMNGMSPVHKIGRQIAGIYRTHVPGATEQDCRALAGRLFEKVNLSPRVYDLYPHQLSGGMLQRVAIGLSLMFNPTLIILDEATTALDVVTESQILREIVQLQQSESMTRIMITHNMGVVASSCRQIVVMYAGRVMESGPTVDVMRFPRHPYTQGLLRSFPSFTGERGNLQGIPGSLPDLSAPIEGCVFAPRCKMADSRCCADRPPAIEISPGWQAACFCAKEGNPL